MLAHVPSFGRNPRGSPDFLAYPVPKACMHVLGTRVPRRLGVARSASSPKAAQALGCSLTPGLRISFGRVTCMARAASVPGLWALGFLLLACVCGWVRVAVGRGFCLPLPVVAGVLGGCVWARFVVLSLFCQLFVVFVVGLWCGPAFGTCVVSCAFPLPPAVSGSGVRCGRPGLGCAPPFLAGLSVCLFCAFFFFFFLSGCWVSLSRALWSLPRLPSFGLGCWLFFFFFCLFRCPFFRSAAVAGLVLPVLAGWSPCACFGVLSSVPSGWGVWPPSVLLVGGLVAVGCFRAPAPRPLFFFFFSLFGGGGLPGCSSRCLPSAGGCSVAGVWCGWSLATPGRGSCVLLPATPGWVSLPVVVGGPRHSWLGFAGGGGVWCVAVVCWWGCGWCVVWLVPRHSWRRFLCATPRHSWLGFASGGVGRAPPLLAGVRWRRCCVVCGVWRWCVGGVVAGVWCGWSLATPGGGSCVLLPATPGWVSLPVVVGGPRDSWLGSACGGGVWCVVFGVWRWCVGGVVAGVWCGWSLATPGGGSCVLLPATPGWVSLPVVVGGPRHSWLGSVGGVAVWCVVCGGGVLVGLWLVCGVVGPSPLLAEVPVCYSPPLLAGFRCRWWWAVPATPGWGPLAALLCGVWCVALVCWWGCGWRVVWLVPRYPGGGSCVLLPATPGWVSLPVVVGGPRHSWLGSACGGSVWCVVCGVWRWCVGGVVAGVWCGWSLATPGGGSCVLLTATPGWVSLPLVVGGPRHSWLGSFGGGGVWCVVGVPRHSWRRFLCATPRHSWLGFAAAGGGRSPPLLAGVRWRRWCACFAWPGRAGRPPGRVVVRLTFSFGRFVFLLCLAPSGLGLPLSLSLLLPFLVGWGLWCVGWLLLGTCSCAVVLCVLCALSGFVAPGGRRCLAPVCVPWLWPAACLSGVPRGPAWCAAPRPVRSLSVLRSAFLTPWCLSPPRELAPPALLGGCAGQAEAGREPGSLCLPLAPAEAGALGSLRLVPIRGPAMGLSLAGPSGVGLGLRALRWLACVDPVTDASGFPYRPSFDGGLGRCTVAVSCGRRHLILRVGGRHTRVPCVFACACSSWPGRAGRPPGGVLVRLTFSFGRFVFLLCLAPSGLGLPLSLSVLLPFLVGCFSRPPAAWLAPRLCLPLGRWLLFGGCSPAPPPLCVSRFSSLLLVALGFFFFFFSFFFFLRAPPLFPAFSGFRPRVPWASALALCVLLALRFSALRALFPLSCSPPGCWLLPRPLLPPPPPLCVSRFSFLPLGAVCRVVLCVPGCGAAACCAVPSGAAHRPGALCSAALCFAVCPRAVCSVLCVFCRGAVVPAVVRRFALCCVCLGVLCCAFPVLSVLCGAVLHCAGALALCCSCSACCCWRLVLWCSAVCCAVSCGVLWCGAGSGGPSLSAGGVFRCRCPCLAAWSASLWLVWFAGLLWCPAFLCRVLWCCAVAWCCAVVL